MICLLKCCYLSNFSIKPNIEGLTKNKKKYKKNSHIKVKKYCIYLYILNLILTSANQKSKILKFSIGNFSKKRSLFNLLSSPNRHKTSMHQLGNNFYKFTSQIAFYLDVQKDFYQIKKKIDYFNFIKILLLFFSIFFKNIYTNLVKLLKISVIVNF